MIPLLPTSFQMQTLIGRCGAALVLTTILAVVLGTGCSRSREDAEVVARVGDEAIRRQDVADEALRRQRAGRPVPDREALLREMVEHRALLQQARASGLESDPAVRRDLEMLLITRWWDREAAPKLENLSVTDAEVAAEYERQRARFTQPGQIRLAMLKLDLPANATPTRRDEVRARLTEARERALKQPTAGGRGPAAIGFGTLAVDYSDDQASRYRGGDLGWLEPGNFNYHWPRPLLETAFALPRGGVSEVIETDTALYVAMHVDSRPASVQPLERVSATLKQSLLVQKRQALEQSIKAAALAARPATVNPAVLAAVELPPAAGPLARSNPAPVPNPPNAALSAPATP